MKKLLSLFLGALLLSGCRLFGGDDNTPAGGNGDFTAVMQQMHREYVEYIFSKIPETDLPAKAEQNFLLSGNVMIPDDPTVEKVSFSVTSQGKSDFTVAGNPVAESNIKLSAEVTGEESGNGLAEFGFRIVSGKLMGALLKLEVNMDQPFPVDAFVAPYIGKWYGATFQEFNDMINTSAGEGSEFHIEDSFRNPQEIMDELRQHIKEALQEVHMWKLEEMLPEENNMFRYRVSFDKEAFQTGILAVVKAVLTNPDGSLRNSEFEQAKTEIEGSFADMNVSLSGILSVNKDNFRYFSFEGTATEGEAGEQVEVKLSWLENSILFSAQKDGEEMKFEKQGDAYTVVVEGKKMMEGSWTDLKKTGTIYGEDGTILATFELNKTGENAYIGNVTIPVEDIAINITNLNWTTRSLHLGVNGTMAKQPLFDGVIDYMVSDADSVVVETPENVQPVQDFLQALLPGLMMGGLSGGTGVVPEMPSDMYEGMGDLENSGGFDPNELDLENFDPNEFDFEGMENMQ